MPDVRVHGPGDLVISVQPEEHVESVAIERIDQEIYQGLAPLAFGRHRPSWAAAAPCDRLGADRKGRRRGGANPRGATRGGGVRTWVRSRRRRNSERLVQ